MGLAGQLPWENGSFDLVSQYTAFTSILDPGLRTRVASEMVRVLKPGGAVLWCDFVYNNPFNPNVRGIRKRAIERLFPDCTITFQRVSLAPPLARRIVPFSWPLAFLLEQLKVLNTHLIALIRPRAAS